MAMTWERLILLSLTKKRPKVIISRNRLVQLRGRCWLLVIGRLDHGSSRILKVTFLGHPVQCYQMLKLGWDEICAQIGVLALRVFQIFLRFLFPQSVDLLSLLGVGPKRWISLPTLPPAPCHVPLLCTRQTYYGMSLFFFVFVWIIISHMSTSSPYITLPPPRPFTLHTTNILRFGVQKLSVKLFKNKLQVPSKNQPNTNAMFAFPRQQLSQCTNCFGKRDDVLFRTKALSLLFVVHFL